MKRTYYEDGSIGYSYEVGDIVECIRKTPGMAPANVGDWGRVYKVDGSTLGVDFVGYSRRKDSFFGSEEAGKWHFRPYNPETCPACNMGTYKNIRR